MFPEDKPVRSSLGGAAELSADAFDRERLLCPDSLAREELPVLCRNVTKRRALAQLVVCSGCCCGQTQRGFPEVPIDWLKALWKEEELNRSGQLTISGCLGPWDLANVVMVLLPDRSEWYGGLAGMQDYAAFVDWARLCHRTDELCDRPAGMQVRLFDRFRNRSALEVEACF